MTILAKYFREINYHQKSYLNYCLRKKTTSNLDNLNITEMNIFIFWEENIAKCIYSHFSIKKYIAFFAWIYQEMDHWESKNAFLGLKNDHCDMKR